MYTDESEEERGVLNGQLAKIASSFRTKLSQVTPLATTSATAIPENQANSVRREKRFFGCEPVLEEVFAARSMLSSISLFPIYD